MLQKTRFLSLRPLNLDNILYQCGFDNLKLVELFRVSEADAFASLPFWIVIPKMTGSQLSSYISRNRIIIPDNCSKSRDSLRNWFLKAILNGMMFCAMKKQPSMRSLKHSIA